MPHPTNDRVTPAHECSDRFDGHVDGKHEEAPRDQLLGPPLGTLRLDPAPGEEPEHDDARERLDERVRSKGDERDRPRGDACGERDRELDDVPGDPAPGKLSCSPLEAQALIVSSRGEATRSGRSARSRLQRTIRGAEPRPRQELRHRDRHLKFVLPDLRECA